MYEYDLQTENHLSFEDRGRKVIVVIRSIGTEMISGQNCFLYHRYGMAHIRFTSSLHYRV